MNSRSVRALIENRTVLSAAMSLVIGYLLLRRMPFPAENSVLQMVLLERPVMFLGIKYAYLTMLFSTPLIAVSMLVSFTYIFLMRTDGALQVHPLPPYPEPATRERLSLVLGEVHHPRKLVRAERPQWLLIPERGLYTGMVIIGAIGSGKTSGCMVPFAEQILAYRALDKEQRAAALVLEVKGDFCYKVQKLLARYGRAEDYIEVSLHSEYRYNPLHNDQDAYALAFGIASLLNNLFGRGKEPFWQQAYTNLVKFIILLHKILYDYVTLFDVYACAISPKLLQRKIEEGEACFQSEFLMIEVEAFEADPGLDEFGFALEQKAARMKARYSAALEKYLTDHRIIYEPQTESGGASIRPIRDQRKQQQFEAVKRWFFEDWQRIEPKLRTSIVEGISVFLSLFDDNPDVKRVFCPPKETYDPVANADGVLGTPLPPFSPNFY